MLCYRSLSAFEYKTGETRLILLTILWLVTRMQFGNEEKFLEVPRGERVFLYPRTPPLSPPEAGKPGGAGVLHYTAGAV